MDLRRGCLLCASFVNFDEMATHEEHMAEILLRLGRIESDAESEKETRKRANDDARKDRAEERKELRDILYDPEKGLAFRVNALEQSNKQRDRERAWLWGVVAAVVLMALKMII